MYYVYDLVDPRDGSNFYVGKGKGSRSAQHEQEARRGVVSEKRRVFIGPWDVTDGFQSIFARAIQDIGSEEFFDAIKPWAA